MSKELDDLIDRVKAEHDPAKSTSYLVGGIAVLIANAGTFPATLHALTTELSERADDIGKAVAHGAAPKEPKAEKTAKEASKVNVGTEPAPAAASAAQSAASNPAAQTASGK